MNIILISDDRIKITLTDRDLDGYGIRIEDIDYDNTETRRVFWTILDKAKSETGFNAALSRIFIQVYPDSHGGCEMYVSRIGERRASKGASDRIRLSVGGSTSEKALEYIYRFDTAEYLVSACKALSAMGFRGASSAYAEEITDGGGCYLIIRGEAKWSLFLSEYGEALRGRYRRWQIAERCAPVCLENAAETLGKL